MTEQTRNALIGQLKSEMQDNADLTNLSNDQLKSLIAVALDGKVEWARANLPEAFLELSSMNYKEKRLIIVGVFESIRGLGVLWGILDDPEVTEVMINGYTDIFVEKNANTSQVLFS